MFLSQVRDNERGTVGDVCAALRDYEGRARSPSVSPEESGSAADEPERLLSPPRADAPAPSGSPTSVPATVEWLVLRSRGLLK